MKEDVPSFRDPVFFTEHIRRALAFDHPCCIDRERPLAILWFEDWLKLIG